MTWLLKSTSPYFLSSQPCEFSLFSTFSTLLDLTLLQLSWSLPNAASDLLREDAGHLDDLHHDRPLHRGRHARLQSAPQKRKKGCSNDDFHKAWLRASKVRVYICNLVSPPSPSCLRPFLCWVLDPWTSAFTVVGFFSPLLFIKIMPSL